MRCSYKSSKEKATFCIVYTEEILDTCNRTPSSHIIQLPLGCTVRGTDEETLDVGQCSDEPCSQKSSFSQTCGVKEDCCCSPRGEEYQERVVISCIDDVMNEMVLFRIKECGCSTCTKRETVFKG